MYDVVADGSRSVWICPSDGRPQTTVVVRGLAARLGQ
jgi:hypothetical protein